MNPILDKTLITGSAGMVGSYIDFGIKTDREVLDVTDMDQVHAVVMEHKPKVIIHLAALTDLEKCEREPDLAHAINVQGTANMARASKQVGAKLVYVSTDAVFDGLKGSPYQEDDMAGPKNNYGLTKYKGEEEVRKNLENYLIVRTSWVFGGGPGKDVKFVAKMMDRIKDPNISELKAVNDQFSTPTYAKDLVEALKGMIIEDKIGVMHVSNTGQCSRFEMAQEMLKQVNSDKKLIPVSIDEFPTPHYQPKNTSLKSNFHSIRPWQEALREYLATEWL